MKPIIFISHIHAESNVAIWLKESISKLLLGGVEFFVSSDRSSIVGGDQWLSKIEDAMIRSSILLVLCSENSIYRPWVNFEAGGAWMAKKRVVPLCHAGMIPSELPEPLGSLQAYELSNPVHLEDLVSLLAKEAELETPSFDAKKLADSVPFCEINGELELTQILINGKKQGTGWLMPTPDLRDKTYDHSRVTNLMEKLSINGNSPILPSSANLRPWFSEVRNQGKLNSSAAHAVVGMLEYFQRRAFNRSLNLSSRFVYKNARNLMHLQADSGATLRAALKAVWTFGVPLDEYWPYTDKKPDFDVEPPARVYAMGFKYEGLVYFCHDPMHSNPYPQKVLSKVKTFLASGIPSVFGFQIFPSFERTDTKGHIPICCPEEEAKWHQALVAVGYDDAKKIINTDCNMVTTGALLIRNSWGTEWGDSGYGWLPYDYILKRVALDFWSVWADEWLDTGQFGR